MSRFRNPWGKPRFLVLFTALYLVWSIVPILVAIRFSFNAGRSRSAAQGWSLRWYSGDPDLSVLHDPELRTALLQSMRLAGIAVLQCAGRCDRAGVEVLLTSHVGDVWINASGLYSGWRPEEYTR